MIRRSIQPHLLMREAAAWLPLKKEEKKKTFDELLMYLESLLLYCAVEDAVPPPWEINEALKYGFGC